MMYGLLDLTHRLYGIATALPTNAGYFEDTFKNKDIYGYVYRDLPMHG